MKTLSKRLLTALFGGVLMICASTASALTYVDSDTFILQKLTAGSNSASYTGQFSILNRTPLENLLFGPQYDPSTMEVISASVSFLFSDDIDLFAPRGEESKITLENEQIFAGSTFFYSTLVGSVLVETELQDGLLNYTITATQGDFYFVNATLTANTQDRSAVPDGGTTVALLGLSMLGLAGVRQKLALQN